jgi:hypothetical protein
MQSRRYRDWTCSHGRNSTPGGLPAPPPILCAARSSGIGDLLLQGLPAGSQRLLQQELLRTCMLSGRRGKHPPDIVAEIWPVRAGLKIFGMVKFTSPFNSRFGRGGQPNDGAGRSAAISFNNGIQLIEDVFFPVSAGRVVRADTESRTGHRTPVSARGQCPRIAVVAPHGAGPPRNPQASDEREFLTARNAEASRSPPSLPHEAAGSRPRRGWCCYCRSR